MFLLFSFENICAGTLPISQRPADARPYISCDINVDKNQVFVGEQINFTVRVVYDPRTYTIQTIVPPTPPDMVLEFLSKSQKDQQQVNGVMCNVYELTGRAYPHKAGSLTLEPFQLKADQRTSTSRGFMGLVMNTSITLFSQKLSLQVSPLPATSLKTCGAVGEYDAAQIELERTSFAAGDAIMMRFTIKGVGNIALCAHPELKLPEHIKWYPAESKKEEGGHCFEYAVQATCDGDMLIPEQSFVYFSPLHRKYMQLKTVPFWIHVSQSKLSKLVDQPVLEDSSQELQLDEQDYAQSATEGQDGAESAISLMRTIVIPDMIFGFLIGIGMLCLCGMRLYGWFFTRISAVVTWLRYRALLARARRYVPKMQKNCDIEPVYGTFKELQAMIDWNRMRTDVRSDAWHAFWQRIECARFDTDRSGEITQDFVQEALAWITYFEM